jgi:hypothetical protein
MIELFFKVIIFKDQSIFTKYVGVFVSHTQLLWYIWYNIQPSLYNNPPKRRRCWTKTNRRHVITIS